VAQEKLYLGFYSVINGLSLMIPGWIALKRTGANSVANEWIIDVTITIDASHRRWAWVSVPQCPCHMNGTWSVV